MDIYACSVDAVARCAEIVRNGGVVVFPTDTVYGIGCDPYNDSSVKRIFSIKGRDEKKPLPILTYSIKDAEKIVTLNKGAKILAERYWPGGLTIVAPIIDKNIPSSVTGGEDSLAVRVPSNKCILSLLEQSGYLIGTSANRSGSKSLKSVQEVLNSSLQGYDAVLDGGPIKGGIESTIIDMTGKPVILREGAVGSKEVLELLERV